MEQDLYLHGLIGGPTVETARWSRPADWLVVPDLEPTDDKIYLLNDVKPNTTANYIAFTCTGNYTVDWGDGVVENVASGVKAQHQYDFDTLNSALTDLGHKQAIITITPNGGTLLTANFSQKHSSVISTYTSSHIVEFKMNCPNMTDLGLNNFWVYVNDLNSIQRIEITAHNFNNTTGAINGNTANNMRGYFSYLYGLKEIILGGSFNTITRADEFLSSNYSLEVITFLPEALDWSSCTNFNSFFYALQSVIELPLLDTSGGLDFSSFYSDCYSLKTVPLNDTSSGTQLRYMFYKCYEIEQLPELNTANITTMASVIDQTWLLKSLPSWNLISIADNNSMPYLVNKKLTSVNFTNIKHNINLSNNLLDRNNIVNVFNNLATAVAKTITVTGNPGTASLTAPDLAIATGKGWTVVT